MDNDNGVKREAEATETADANETIDPRQYPPGYEVVSDDAEPKQWSFKYGFRDWTLAALSPFIYLALGFLFGWWMWGWIIIPVAGIACGKIKKREKWIALSPFLYLMLGFLFGWWAWGWIVIPVSAILFEGIYKKS